MNSLCLIVALSLVSTAAEAPASGLQWHSDYGKALEAAREQQKPLLVVLERGESEQGRVKQVSFEIDAEYGALLSPYVLCRVDVTTPYGEKVAKAFSANQFPYTAITDRTVSQLIYQNRGTYSTEQWLETLVAYREGKAILQPVLQPTTCFRCR